MPYIKQDQRKKFDEILALVEGKVEDAGELNYLITSICHQVLSEKGLKYSNLNEIVGALECAKLELYRRVAAPYEDTKIAQNGDVHIL